MDIMTDLAETHAGMTAAWRAAQEFFDSRKTDKGALLPDDAARYAKLIERVAQHGQHVERLEQLWRLYKVMGAVKGVE
jgi:hypothetical protein